MKFQSDNAARTSKWPQSTGAFGAFRDEAHRETVFEETVRLTGCGFFDGGCVLLARALQQVYGGEVMVIEGRMNGGALAAQHAFVKFPDGVCADGYSSGSESAVANRFLDEEGLHDGSFKLVGCRHWREGDLRDSPADTNLVHRLMEVLKTPAPIPSSIPSRIACGLRN